MRENNSGIQCLKMPSFLQGLFPTALLMENLAISSLLLFIARYFNIIILINIVPKIPEKNINEMEIKFPLNQNFA